MKGVALPIETIVILALAIIVLGILLWFFVSSSSPAIDLVKLKQKQSIWCSSYQQNNPECSEDKDADIDTDLQDKLADICYKLNQAEGGYPRCDGTFNNECIQKCCKMYCGVTTTT